MRRHLPWELQGPQGARRRKKEPRQGQGSTAARGRREHQEACGSWFLHCGKVTAAFDDNPAATFRRLAMKSWRFPLAALLVAFAAAAGAQSWPAKTVRIVSPFPPGGSVDQVARILAAQL